MSPEAHPLFGQLLLERGIVTQQQLDRALMRQEERRCTLKLGEVLVRQYCMHKDRISEVLAVQLGVPLVKLSEREIPERIIGLVDTTVAQIYRVIPVAEQDDGQLILAIDDPMNIVALDNVARLTGRSVEPVVSTWSQIGLALEKYYGRPYGVDVIFNTTTSSPPTSSVPVVSGIGVEPQGALCQAEGAESVRGGDQEQDRPQD